MALNIILLYVLIGLSVINLFSKFLFKFSTLFSKKNSTKWSQSELLEAISFLSKKKTGALIAFENSNSLIEYINKAEEIDANINKELILAIFQKKSPLHDGAIIISDGTIKAASAYFPTSNKKISTKYGARHRAALGLSNTTDAFVIVVSETTGKITIANKGALKQISIFDLEAELQGLI